jgi:hypothetical protein
MKIAIFGDSFAEPVGCYDGLAWHDHLRDRGYHVDNYSQTGASQLWICDQFQSHHADYDRVLVVKTGCRRLWLPHAPGSKQLFTGIDDCEHYKKTSGWSQRSLARAIEHYYKHIQNDLVDLAVTQLILAQTAHVRPDAVILPALRLPQDAYPGNPHCVAHLEDIYNINIKQAAALRPTADVTKLTWGNRLICHMTRQNNRQLALDCEQWLNGGSFQLVLDRYCAFSPEDLDYYFPEQA